MINPCIFSCCYDDKQGRLPAHLAKPAIFLYVRVETSFVSLLLKGGRVENSAQL